MKIDQQGLSPASAQVGLQGDSGGRPKTSGNKNSVQDQARFSSLGATASQLRTRLESVPDVRQDRVDFYRQQIASGTYKVDPQAVAGAMLQEFDGDQDGQ
jgi:flagellar biosynthesis anti-sigma factor FlgM